MPSVTALNLFVNIGEQYSPRESIDHFNYPEIILEFLLLILGYYAIIRSVKTVMLFGCIAYFAFGLMYAYEEVLRETRDVMFRADFNFNFNDSVDPQPLQQTYSPNQYRFKLGIKYSRLLGTLMFITIGLALYSLRRIRIMRAIGNMKNEDTSFRVVLKRVQDFNLDFKEDTIPESNVEDSLGIN